jgi:uncharacterized membrane protein
MNNEVVLTISLMAAATLATRLGGFWAMGRIKWSRFVERWLKNLPGALVLAIVAPAVFSENTYSMLAAAGVIITMIWTRNFLLAMIAGLGIIAAARNLL